MICLKTMNDLIKITNYANNHEYIKNCSVFSMDRSSVDSSHLCILQNFYNVEISFLFVDFFSTNDK